MERIEAEAPMSNAEVINLLHQYVNLKELTEKYIESRFARSLNQQIREISEQTNKKPTNFDTSELNKTVEKLVTAAEVAAEEEGNICRSLKKEIKLLEILIAKRNCPISAIVDKL